MFVVLLVIDPTSHELGSPAKPGRFISEKEQEHNKAALGARKREMAGAAFNLASLPSELLNDLRCVKEVACSLRKLEEIYRHLKDKHLAQSHDIRGLLSKYKR